VQTRRLAASFEQLSTTFGTQVTHAKPCAVRLFWCENPQQRPDAKVLRLSTPVLGLRHSIATAFYEAVSDCMMK